MSKTKWYTRAVYLTVALAMTVGLLMVPAAGADTVPPTEVCGCFTTHDNGTAVWDSTDPAPHVGSYSVGLTLPLDADSYAYVKAFLPGSLTFGGITGISYHYYVDSAGSTLKAVGGMATKDGGYTFDPVYQAPYLAIQVDTDGDGEIDGGFVQHDVSVLTSVDAWFVDTIESTELWHGTFSDGNKTFAEMQALYPTYEVLSVSLHLDKNGTHQDEVEAHSYVDDITINGVTYDLVPCYELVPDIAKNVKTADETFTVMDACGEEVDASLVSNWHVTKGEGEGEVSIVDGGGLPAGNNSITVRMITMGDCIITCDVTSGDYEVTLHAEKKWGEIEETELTAWDDDPCNVARPVGAESEISRVIDLGGADSVDVLVQEEVIANFLPGPVPAPAGGAKITWWLLENDEDGYAQADLEELVDRFDTSSHVSGELGYGEGCGQYGAWADDPTFIPEDIINGIYATYAASNTDFVKEECSSVADRTKTVTYTDHVGDPLGEGFTNVTVQFDEIGATDLAEPVIVVVLADYPLDKNGENAVCVEYFKFKSTVVVTPEVCQVKAPQVRWAGEKIVLEKDWGEGYVGKLVGFFLEEGTIGNMIPDPMWVGVVSQDARTAYTVVGSDGVARAMFETEQQGEVDVKCVLYDAGMPYLGDDVQSFAEIQSVIAGGPVLGNHGFLVYYLALEDVAVDTELSDLTAIDAGVDADVLVKVRGWFTSPALPGTDRDPVDANGDHVYELPAGRYVLPDDWAALAGSDEATTNMASRPQYDMMNTVGDGVDSADEWGPYDSGVRTTTPPGEADDPVIGPFNTLQPWNCFDDLGNPTNMWIADDVVPADDDVCVAGTGCLRNTVVPDTTIDWYDCPMPQALVTFDVDDTEVLNALDKGDVFFSGSGASKVYTAPFYAMEIPSHWLIPVGGYRWDSWGLWTTPITDDGPYDFWTDLGITPNDDDILEVYSDNHGYAGVEIEGTGLADECVTLDVVADFPVMAAKYPAVADETGVCWGIAVEHLNADFEVSDRTAEAPITISFYGLKGAGAGAPWTTGGTEPYVKAEWDFDGNGTIDETIVDTTSALTLVTQTFEFTAAGSYSPWLRVTDDNGLVDICEKPNYIILTGAAGYAACDIDESGTVDLTDFVLFATAYGSSLGDANWDARCDLDSTDGIDLMDFVLFAQCYVAQGE